jgi:hypothetical protein
MKKIIKLLLFPLLFFVSSCTKDFIVKDIKNATIKINAPADNIKTPSNKITFWWDEIDGAEKYNLQIVKPNFDTIIQLLVDTNIITNKFNYTFAPGTYKWRVRATNSSGSTAYVTRTLIVDSTSNLNLVSVGLIAPAAYSVMGNNNVNFSWNALPSATSYEVVLSSSTGSLIATITTSNTSQSFSFTTISGVEEKFSWQVIAFNTNTSTQTINNTTRTFKIDHKSPLAPTLNKPVFNATVKDSSSFRWQYISNSINNDIQYDSIFIGSYPDSTFLSPISFTAVRSGTINNYPIKPTLTSPTNTLTASPYYYWKVKSIDSVGNVSPASSTFKFKLQN